MSVGVLGASGDVSEASVTAGQRSALLPTSSPFRETVTRGLTSTTVRLEGAYRVHGARAAASQTTALPAAFPPWAVERTGRGAHVFEVRAAAGQRPTLLTAGSPEKRRKREDEKTRGGGS